MKMKRVSALLMCAAMTASLAACGGGEKGTTDGAAGGGGNGEKLSVMIWDNYQEPGHKEIIGDFTEETGIEAEVQVVDRKSVV